MQLLSEYERPGKEHHKILLMSWAGWVFDFYDLILYSFLLIPIGKEFGFSKLEMSYVLGASLAATAVGGILFGLLSDRYGRKKVLEWTILTYSIGTFLCGFTNSLALLLVFRIITGLGVGGEWATGQTYIGETFPPKVRGRYGAYMQTGAPIGVALAAIVGGFLAPVIGWRECFMISVLPALLVVWIRKMLPESDMWLRRKELAASHSPEKETLLTTGKECLWILFSPVNRRLFFLCLILAIFDMSAYWFTYSWLPAYLHEERHFSMVKSALWMLITQAGGFLGYFTFGFVADKIGRRPAFSIYSVLMASGLLAITIFWPVIAAYPQVILVFMFLVGFGTGMFGGYGPLFSELFPTTVRNTAMGSAFNLARGVQFFTPIVIAVVAQKYGLSGGIALAALFALLTGAWVWTLPETKGRKLLV